MLRHWRTDPLQTRIDGFGACFNELAWTSLSAIEMRTKRLFSENCSPPAFGANFNTCRRPVGANDFSLDMAFLRRDARQRLVPFEAF